jgi:hypothetical protein
VLKQNFSEFEKRAMLSKNLWQPEKLPGATSPAFICFTRTLVSGRMISGGFFAAVRDLVKSGFVISTTSAMLTEISSNLIMELSLQCVAFLAAYKCLCMLVASILANVGIVTSIVVEMFSRSLSGLCVSLHRLLWLLSEQQHINPRFGNQK